MSSSLFISDLHLDPARPETTRALATFLEQRRHSDALYILGDLFESWIGDDDDAPMAVDVCTMLRQFSDSGPALYLMHGNRDFLVGQDFCSRAGATLLPDPTVIDLYGTPTVLMHGDSLCITDTDYQAFRKRARDPAWQADILARDLPERRELAGQLRQMSREALSNKAEDIVDVTPEEVARVMAEHGEHGVKQLIHGHTHRPARHNMGQSVRWVLGDWDRQGWFLEATEHNIELHNIHIIQ